MLENLFETFGLQGSERALMQSIFEHGPQTASRLAKFTRLPRNTARSILDRLVTKGLLQRSIKTNANIYSLERKETLVALLDQEKEEYLRNFNERCKAITQLADTYGTSRSVRRPRVVMYEDTQDLKRLYEDTLTATTGICSWASFDENKKAMPKYFNTYYRRRAKKRILMRSIHPDSPLARSHKKNNRNEYRECLLVPANSYSIRPEIQVYNNKVNIVSWQDRIGIIIESQDIADALRAIFDLSFEGAQHLQKT